MTYSSSLALGRERAGINNARRNQNAVSFRQKDRRLGPISNTVMLVVLACVLGLIYLTQVTKTNAYGYQINNLQQKQTSLQSEHDDLEVASARLQSLDRVQTSTVARSLTPTVPTATIQN